VTKRRAVTGIAVAASACLLAGCGFDSPAVTNSEHTSVQGANFSVGAVQVRDVFVTTLQTSETKATSYVVATLVNRSPRSENLTGITSRDGSVTLTGSGVFNGALSLPPNGVPLEIDQPLLSPSGPTASLAAATTPAAGTFVPLQFTFAGGGTSAVLQAPVVPPTETTASSAPVPDQTATPPPLTGQSAND
jgi:hypothetical protein